MWSFSCTHRSLKHANDETILRNESAIILHATFEVGSRKTRYLMVGDSTWEILEEIVDITRKKGNVMNGYSGTSTMCLTIAAT